MKKRKRYSTLCHFLPCLPKLLLLFVLLAWHFPSFANHDTSANKLQVKLALANKDAEKAIALKDICWYYRYISLDSCLKYGKASIAMAKKTGDKRLEGDVSRYIGICYWHYALEEEGLRWVYASLAIAEQIGDKSGEAYCYDNIGNTFYSQGFYDKALENFSKAKQIFLSINDDKGVAYTLLHSSWVYVGKKQFDTAMSYVHQAIAYRRKVGDSLLVSGALKEMANVYRAMGRYNDALAIYHNSKTVFEKANIHYSLADDFQQMAETFRLAGMNDSAVFYGLRSMEVTKGYNNYRQVQKTAKTLQLAYTAAKNYERALFYQNMYYENKERLLNDRIALKLEHMASEHEYEIKTEHLKARNLEIVILLSALLLVALLIATVIYLSQRKTKIYNHLLETKNAEITKQSAALGAQTAELRRLNEVKDKMFSVVSHDIRSPLTSLQSMLYLYNNAFVTPEEIKQLMPNITQHVNNTASFVDNLLYWSKSQFKGLHVTKAQFNLNECIEGELELLANKADEKKIAFKWEGLSNVQVFADKDMLAVVMRNLLNNAVKFTGEGKTVFIKISDVGNETIMCIKDEGRGMTAEQVSSLFVTSNTTSGTANETGTGLGLILSKDFIEKNGGRIWAESSLGEGSSFYVALQKQ